MNRRTLTILITLGTALGAPLVACGGDDSSSPTDAPDGSTPGNDGGVPGDDAGADAATNPDADVDASADAAADAPFDAGPPVTLDGGACDASAVAVTGVDPKFGWTGGKTALTITGVGFVATPTVYLKSSTGVLTAVPHPAFVSSSSIVAEIDAKAAGLAAGTYGIVVSNPGGCAGTLADAFKLVAGAPPSNIDVAPAAGTTQTNTGVTITGCDFPAAAALTLSTVDASGNVKAQTIDASSVSCSASAACAGGMKCTAQGSIASTAMPPGLYVVRVGNSTDATYGDFASFVVTDPSGKLGAGGVGWVAAAPLNVGRRGLGMASGRLDSANHFLYAVGGENAAGTALDSVEVARLDRFGRIGGWFVQRNKLKTPRSGLSVVRQGDWLYAIGGTSSTAGTAGSAPTGSPLATIERAKILRHDEAPKLTAATADATAGTLAKGTYYYRVAAVLSGADTTNPQGETLPSDELSVDVGATGEVTLTWTASSNANVDHYVVYRTKGPGDASGTELRIADSVSGLTYVDKGVTPAADALTPLARGSTGVWTSVGSPLLHARLDAAAAIAPDGVGGQRIYVTGGWGTCTVGAAAMMNCTESLGIDATGATVDATWVAGANLGTARMRHGMSALTAANEPSDAGTNGGFLVIGGGASASAATSPPVEYAPAAVAGVWKTANASYSNRDASQLAIVNGWAYAFMGGKQAPYSGTSELAAIAGVTSTAVTFGSWSSTSQTLPSGGVTGRFGLGVESAYFYAVGGTSDEKDALTSVYQIVY